MAADKTRTAGNEDCAHWGLLTEERSLSSTRTRDARTGVHARCNHDPCVTLRMSLEDCVAQPTEMSGALAVTPTAMIDYEEGNVLSHTLLKRGGGAITLFAFDEGQSLSEHTASFDPVARRRVRACARRDSHATANSLVWLANRSSGWRRWLPVQRRARRSPRPRWPSPRARSRR